MLDSSNSSIIEKDGVKYRVAKTDVSDFKNITKEEAKQVLSNCNMMLNLNIKGE